MRRIEIARCSGFDIGWEDHGLPYIFGDFDMDGTHTSLGYQVDIAFLFNFLAVFKAERLQLVNGRECRLVFDKEMFMGGNLIEIRPLFKKDGSPFILEEWRSWREKWDWPTPYEMRTLEKKADAEGGS